VPQDLAGTEFERRRGATTVEIRDGFAQVHVQELTEPIHESRLFVLERIAQVGISIDFLKLTTDGLSFLIPEARAELAQRCLSEGGHRFELHHDRSIVLANAVNMRDEEGLIARIVSVAIATGVPIDHLADMHDRLLIVVEQSGARQVAHAIESTRGSE